MAIIKLNSMEKRMSYAISRFFILLLLLSSCGGNRQLSKSSNLVLLRGVYEAGILDAQEVKESEITTRLTPIGLNNKALVWKEIDGKKYFLVTSWKADASFYKNDPKTGKYNTGAYEMWVTVAPELKKTCQNPSFGRTEGVELRLKQLLGLPPTTKQQYVVEFWVQPDDLYRPCPDPEVTDTSCGLEFPANATDEHKAWINELKSKSYSNAAWDSNYPWTALGYTYDWNPSNQTHIGLSEFVVKKGREIIVKDIYTTAEYCKVKE